jgi:hypothetical protein
MLRTDPPPVQHPNNVVFGSDVVPRWLMGRTPGEEGRNDGMLEYGNDGERGCLSPPNTPLFQYSTIPFFHPALPSCFRPPPRVPGFFWFRARVIVRANDYSPPPPDGPPRPIPRLPGRGKVPTFPPPEPPLSTRRTGPRRPGGGTPGSDPRIAKVPPTFRGLPGA